jgi:hypothetical protein
MPDPTKTAAPLVPPSSGAPPAASPHHRVRRVTADDMDDSAEIKDYEIRIEDGHVELQPLQGTLVLLQETIYKAFTRCDQDAVHYQKWYQRVSSCAVFFGATTILCGILEFIFPDPAYPMLLPACEITAAALTLILVAIGSIGKMKENWLEARYKAENLRLLKFRKLTDSRLWCPPINVDLLKEELEDDVRNIEAQNYEEARTWSSQGVIPSVCAAPCIDTCDVALHELIEYYRPKRLHVQMDYLVRKSKWGEIRGSRSSLVVQMLFFASFTFVLAHLLVPVTKNTFPFNAVLTAIAAGLPVIAAAIKTYRASREFERNALRHRATLHSLEILEVRLRNTNELGEKFRQLGFCELVLEMDCREFMRLLCDVEWYG